MSLVRHQRERVNGSLGERTGSSGGRAGYLHERVADVLSGRIVGEKAADLNGRAGALSAL